MTRYEAWLLIPAFPIYYFHKTRKTSTAGLVLLILLLFPVGWMLENYVHRGELLIEFSAVKKGAEIVGAHTVDLFSAIYPCINNATCVLLIRPQITSNLL
jgi:hypothetical protein